MCDCNHIFNNFSWVDLASITTLPNKKRVEIGVYAIRIRKIGNDIIQVISDARKLSTKVEWKLFLEFFSDRIDRLERIVNCPIIYIGATNDSIQCRYEGLCGQRHTIFFPILALLINGWKLDFGWRLVDKPSEEEKSLKLQYKKIHGVLPALVDR